ncbi:hypothetical protein V1478_002864 [Vespula squamosa]|uniref:Uncharacterized protein n=1 Tax=Vespula squamosa TaxID=30214 RepID=A0ABD2BRJ6_VESSQ
MSIWWNRNFFLDLSTKSIVLSEITNHTAKRDTADYCTCVAITSENDTDISRRKSLESRPSDSERKLEPRMHQLGPLTIGGFTKRKASYVDIEETVTDPLILLSNTDPMK